MKKVSLSAPWTIYYREIEELFGSDPEIRVEYDEEKRIIKLYVENPEKAAALSELLPIAKTFGNVTVYTRIIPANGLQGTRDSLFQAAFRDNPIYSYTRVIDGILTNPISYVVFKNRVVQYFADNMHDINGNCSTLYQEIAKDVFGEDEGICFCTDTEEKAGA